MDERRRAGLLAALAFVALALARTGIHGDLATRVYGGGGGDPGMHGWALTTVATQLLREPWRPFEGNIYYPSHHSVLFGDPLLGPAVLVLPLRALGAGPVLLFNAATLLSLVVASWGSYRVARRLGAPRAGAFLAGVAVPYTGQQMERLVHLNLLAIPFLPWLLLGLLDLLERPGWRPALVAGLAFALQAATSGYHAFGVSLLALVVAAWGWRRLADRRVLAWGLLSALLAGLLLLPYVSGFLELAREEARMSRGLEVARANGLDLASFFVSRAWLWRGLLPDGQPFFPGLAVLLLAGRALLGLRGDRRVRLLALLALAAFVMALGPEVRWRGTPLLPGPFALAMRLVPLLDAMRHPYTLAVPGLMALGLLAALGLGGLRRGWQVAAVALTVAEAFGDTPARLEAPRELPPVYAELARLAASEASGGPLPATLELPLRDKGATWRAALHGLPVVNGVGSFEPQRYQGLAQLLKRDGKGAPRDLTESLAFEHLKTWFPARFVLLRGRGTAELRALAEASPRSLELLYASPEGDRIYRLRRGGRGRELARGFREDQLRAGRLQARASARPPAALVATLGGASLGPPLPVGPEPRQLEWAVPAGLVRRGLNLLELRLEGPAEAVLELEDVEAAR